MQINARFGKDGYEPFGMLIEHHGSSSVTEHYRAADVCVVTSLHDGMNLVAKEFVAARDDERGVLVLSQFAGAARELHEALIVNPYHIEEVAEAMHRALSNAARRAARTHGQPAQPGPARRVQRVSVGGPHADDGVPAAA